MMKATPAPSLVVAQAEFRFKLLIVPFNAPAHLGSLDQIYQRGISGHSPHTQNNISLPYTRFRFRGKKIVSAAQTLSPDEAKSE
jgi:hypothetical protein